MSEEPTFRIGEIAVMKSGLALDTKRDLSGIECEIASERGDHRSISLLNAFLGSVIIADSYYVRWTEAGPLGLVSHKFLSRKRRPDELPSNQTFTQLIQTLKESIPCELNTPSITSEPLEEESSATS